MPVGPHDTLFRELCSHLTKEQWMFSFLFNVDPLSDMALLTSPHSAKHAVVIRECSSAVEASAAHAKMLDHRTETKSLCVPGFALDGVTAGMWVHDKSSVKAWPFGQRRSLHFSRFVRFEEEGILVEVRDVPGGGLDILYSVIRNSRRKTNTRVMFSCGAGEIEMEGLENKLRGRLMQVYKTEFCRRCGVCGIESGGICRCGVKGVVGGHLLDFKAHGKNAEAFVGRYAGGAAVEMFREGVQSLCAGLECEENGMLEERRGDVATLTQMAIQNRLGCYQTQPNDEMNFVSWGKDCTRMGELLVMGLGGNAEEVDNESLVMERKEKNRMAAARSNLKRKWKNKSLRLNIVILRYRIAELKEVENELRCEQAWLRQRCRTELEDEVCLAGPLNVRVQNDFGGV